MSITSNNFAELCFDEDKGIVDVIAILMKGVSTKFMFWCCKYFLYFKGIVEYIHEKFNPTWSFLKGLFSSEDFGVDFS